MSGNKRTKVGFEFEVTDLPMIAHAFAIARNTSMMCSHPRAAKRLEELRKAIEALVPAAARVFDHDVWAEIGMALSTAKTWTVGLAIDRWSNSWDRSASIGVRVDDRLWTTKRSEFSDGAPQIEAVRDLLRELAPLGCEEAAPDWTGDLNIRFAAISKADLIAVLTEFEKAPPQAKTLTKDKLVAATVEALDKAWGDGLRKKLAGLSVSNCPASEPDDVFEDDPEDEPEAGSAPGLR